MTTVAYCPVMSFGPFTYDCSNIDPDRDLYILLNVDETGACPVIVQTVPNDKSDLWTDMLALSFFLDLL